MKILIVEDNQVLSKNLATYLKLKGFETKVLGEGKMVNYELDCDVYDLVILDLGLPDISGLEVCERIRHSQKNIPVLMLTSRSMIEDKKAGFNSGADDYLTKPFDYEELLLRINSLLRRNFSVKSNLIIIGDLQINETTKVVTFKGNNLDLSKLEFGLLLYLAHNKARVISKDIILEKVWGEVDELGQNRVVDVYIGYLRKKIHKDFIKTVRGEGYIIE